MTRLVIESPEHVDVHGGDNDFHPVAASAAVGAGDLCAAQLLGVSLVVWRDAAGAVHAWDDRCPHRGTRLSIGRVDGDHIVCAYHGWQFGSDGRCIAVPS